MARQRTGGERLRLLTYNILLGGRYREERISTLVAHVDADVVLLQEVVDLALPRRLGRELGMRMIAAKPSDPDSNVHNVILSRLPIQRWRNHRHPGVMLRGHLEAELVTGSSRLPLVRIHNLHLAARFGERANGEARRMRELAAVFRDLQRLPPMPHIFAGDFNAIAPGDTVLATRFFERMSELRKAGVMERGEAGLWGPRQREEEYEEHDAKWLEVGVHPHLDVGVPTLPGIVFPVVKRLPRTEAMDRVLNRFIERWTIEHMLERGYTDCYRALHPHASGLTCATWMPAARIDYFFADEHLAPALRHIDVVGSRSHPEPLAATASDHFPVIAEFRV